MDEFDMKTRDFMVIYGFFEVKLAVFWSKCDAPKPGGPLTTRQPAEYKWMSGYPTPLQKIGQSLLCTGSSTQLQNLHILSQTIQYMQYISQHE